MRVKRLSSNTMGGIGAVLLLAVASLGLVDAFLAFPAAGLRPARVPVQRAQRVAHCGLRAATSQFGLGKLFGRGGEEKGAEKKATGKAEALKAELIALCDETNFGVYGKGETPNRFDEIVNKLRDMNPTANGAESARMNGRWKMLWTDEQEVLFLVEKGLFWDPCLAVYQDFDVAEEKFGNIIEFDNESKFTVQSSFEPLGNRFDFKFQTAQIKWRQFQVPIPPVGAGWSEQIYLDDTFRMAKDSRGVLLIVQKQ